LRIKTQVSERVNSLDFLFYFLCGKFMVVLAAEEMVMFNCEKEVIVCLLCAGATTHDCERRDRELRFPSSVSFESSKRAVRES